MSIAHRPDRLLLGGLLLVVAALVLAIAPTGAASATSDPPAPGDLSAVALSVQKVVLRWVAAPLDPAAIRYSIRRDSTRIAVVNGDQLSYIDITVQPGRAYVYSVRAIEGEEASLASNSVTVQVPSLPDTPDLTPPSPPENLTAAASESMVLLDWYAANDDTDITAYLLRRDGLPLALLGAGTLRYEDTGLTSGANYTYTVEAFDVVEHASMPSNPVQVVLP